MMRPLKMYILYEKKRNRLHLYSFLHPYSRKCKKMIGNLDSMNKKYKFAKKITFMRNNISCLCTLPIFMMAVTSCHECGYNTSKTVDGIKVENSRYDVGIVDKSGNADCHKRYSFILENTTDHNVEFDSAEVSCTCLTIDHYPSLVKANSSDSVTGHINISELHGKFSRFLYLNFKDGEVMLLRVVGEAK